MRQTPAARTGANVRAEMARAGISQTSLATSLGISQAAVSKRLRGEVAFNVDELAAVAALFGMDVRDLLPTAPAASTP